MHGWVDVKSCFPHATHFGAGALCARGALLSSDDPWVGPKRTEVARERSPFSRTQSLIHILSCLHSSYRDDVVSQHMHFHIRILENDLQHIRN